MPISPAEVADGVGKGKIVVEIGIKASAGETAAETDNGLEDALKASVM